MKKKLIWCCIMLCLLELCSISVCAFRPSPFLFLEITLNDVPQNTAYIDLLIPIQENDSHFVQEKDKTDCITNILDYTVLELPNSCEIASYNDMYYSYHFHYKDSTISMFTVENDDRIAIYYGENQNLLDEYLMDIDNFKLAFVDAQGNILKVSKEVSLNAPAFKTFSGLKIENSEVITEYIARPDAMVLVGFAALLVMIVSIILICKIKKSREKQIIGQFCDCA